MQNLWWAQKTLWVRTLFSPLMRAVSKWGGTSSDRPDSARDIPLGTSDEVSAAGFTRRIAEARMSLAKAAEHLATPADPQLKSHDCEGTNRKVNEVSRSVPPLPPKNLLAPQFRTHAAISDALARGGPEDVLADDPPERDRCNAIHVDDAAAQVQDAGTRGQRRAGRRDARAAGAAAESGAPGGEERTAEHDGQNRRDGAEGV